MSDLTGSDPGPQAEDATAGKERAPRRSEGPPSWLRTSALVVGGALVLVLLFVVASAVLPGWWAATIGRQVDGVGSAGVLWGLFYGIVFTLLPLAVVFLAIRPNWHWKTRLIVGGVALLLTAPNLLTLAVAAGTSADTREARTLMAIQAPNFRLATLIGVIATIVVGAVAGFVIWRLVASRRELHKLRSGALDRDKAEPQGKAGGKRRRGRSGSSELAPDTAGADPAVADGQVPSTRRATTQERTGHGPGSVGPAGTGSPDSAPTPGGQGSDGGPGTGAAAGDQEVTAGSRADLAADRADSADDRADGDTPGDPISNR